MAARCRITSYNVCYTKLLRALGAAFKTLQAVIDGVFDGLVVAGLEMQAGDVFDRTPVATVERLLVRQEPGAGQRYIVPVGDQQSYNFV